MKKITNLLKTLIIALAVFSFQDSSAQCNASFTYSLNANGNVSFFAANNASTSVYYWSFGNSTPTYTGMGSAGQFPSTTYTANGTYVVSLFILNISPSCSIATQQTIVISNVSNTCNINANFGYTQGSNGVVNFNNTTTGTVSGVTYNWNFGDNTTPSTATSPVHTYSANGTYVATLTANNNLSVTCMGTKTLAIVVNSYCTLNANFTYSVTGGTVNFTNLTTPSVSASYTWSFGNSLTSTALNPNTTYTTNGTYVVTLMASQGSCTSSITQTITITNAPACNLVANFGISQSSNGVVNFNNTSTGTLSGVTYAWAFGDGGTSTSTSPAHTYSANGTYVATLTANNNMTPTCVSTKTMMINVASYCLLNANFTYSVGANGNVTFANTTTGTGFNTIYSWNFGDASATSTATNPSHTYANGTYYVLLTATNFSTFPACNDTIMQQIVVTTNTCVANANFTLQPSNTAQLWFAIPTMTSNIANAVWSWGDSSSSNTLFTSHQYSAAGTYTICLSLTLTCGGTDSYCTSYYVFKSSSNSNSEMIQVNVLAPGTTGVGSNVAEESEYSLYPNPTHGQISVKMNGLGAEKVKLNVFNIMGQRVLESSCETHGGKLDKQIDLGKEPNGVYFVEVIAGDKTFTKKIVMNK